MTRSENGGRRVRKVGVALVVPIGGLLLWWLVVKYGLVYRPNSAGPREVARVLWQRREVLFSQARISCWRLVAGIAIGSVLGLATGILLARSGFLRRLVGPSLQFLAPVPIVVWVPFAVVLFGLGDGFKIALVSLSAFFLVHFNTFQATRSVPKDFLELASVYEKTSWQVFRHVLFPSALPSVLTGLRLSLSLGWVILSVAEFSEATSGSQGLGYFILYHHSLLQMPEAFAGVVVLGAIGILTDSGVAWIQRLTSRWADVEGPREPDATLDFRDQREIGISDPLGTLRKWRCQREDVPTLSPSVGWYSGLVWAV